MARKRKRVVESYGELEKELIDYVKGLPLKYRTEGEDFKNGDCVVYCGEKESFFVRPKTIKKFFREKEKKGYHIFLSYLRERGWKKGFLFLPDKKGVARFYVLPESLQSFLKEKVEKKKDGLDFFIDAILERRLSEVKNFQASSLSEAVDLLQKNKLFWYDEKNEVIYLRVKKIAGFWGASRNFVISRIKDKASQAGVKFSQEVILWIEKEEGGKEERVLRPESYSRISLLKISFKKDEGDKVLSNKKRKKT